MLGACNAVRKLILPIMSKREEYRSKEDMACTYKYIEFIRFLNYMYKSNQDLFWCLTLDEERGNNNDREEWAILIVI